MAQQQASNDEGFSLSKKMAAASTETIDRILRITNLINSFLLVLAAVLALIESSFSLILLMIAIYVALFGLLIFCFELRFKFFEEYIFKNFGFMFTFGGRVCFFIFIGCLAIGFNSIAGYVSVVYTGLNLLFNYWCMSIHPKYREFLRQDQERRQVQAANRMLKHVGPPAGAPPAQSHAVDITPASAFEAGNQVSSPAGVSAAAATPDSAWPSSEWEKIYDESTKLYYYHNHSTGETRWDEPK